MEKVFRTGKGVDKITDIGNLDKESLGLICFVGISGILPKTWWNSYFILQISIYLVLSTHLDANNKFAERILFHNLVLLLKSDRHIW